MGLPKWEFSTGKKHFMFGKKSGKMTLPLLKIFLLGPCKSPKNVDFFCKSGQKKKEEKQKTLFGKKVLGQATKINFNKITKKCQKSDFWAKIYSFCNCPYLFILTFFYFLSLQMSHASASATCRSQKLACELYPSRVVCLCLDPYCGLGFVLWCLSSVYSGHQSILIPPAEIESNPALWLTALSQYKGQ